MTLEKLIEVKIHVVESSHEWTANPTVGDGRFHSRDESADVGGVLYTRSSCKGGEPAPPTTDHFKATQGQHPGVRCGKCFGAEFTLVYESYGIRARCVSCGHEDEVYSG